MPMLSEFTEQDPGHLEFVEAQIRESKENAGCAVTCRCGLKAPMRHLYRCFYCGEWMCHKCSEYHFGQSREEYYRDPLARWKLTFKEAV